MAEVNAKSIVINVGSNNYKVTSMGFEDMCNEIGVKTEEFREIFSRDFYTPKLEQAPTSSDMYYTDPANGLQTPFREGQCCVYPDDESSDGWGFSIAKYVTTDSDGSPTSILWQKFINEASMGKETIYGLFGLSV